MNSSRDIYVCVVLGIGYGCKLIFSIVWLVVGYCLKMFCSVDWVCVRACIYKYIHWLGRKLCYVGEYFYASSDMLNCKGMYYLRIGNEELAVEYFVWAVSKGNIEASYNLGCYWEDIGRDDWETEKYYLYAVSQTHVKAMGRLGTYYLKKREYDQAIKYYLMAISNGCIDSMENLGLYYRNIPHHIDQCVKYLVMACKYRHGILRELIDINELTLGFETRYLIYKCVISSGVTHYMEKILKHVNGFELWKLLNKLKEDGVKLCEQTSNKLKHLYEKVPSVKIFKQRLIRAKKYNTLDNCPICWSADVLNIDLGCAHGVCYNCWVPTIKCFYKCES